MPDMTALETLRQSYRPDTIRVLFVGESPPAGGTFFYMANSNLSRYTQQAFSAVFNTKFASGQEFLQYFQGLGCYLEDLCLQPINKVDNAQRRRLQTEAIPSLVQRLQPISPFAVIAVMRAIRPHVDQALREVGLNTIPVYDCPFPSLGNQKRYIVELSEALRDLQSKGILAPNA